MHYNLLPDWTRRASKSLELMHAPRSDKKPMVQRSPAAYTGEQKRWIDLSDKARESVVEPYLRQGVVRRALFQVSARLIKLFCVREPTCRQVLGNHSTGCAGHPEDYNRTVIVWPGFTGMIFDLAYNACGDPIR